MNASYVRMLIANDGKSESIGFFDSSNADSRDSPVGKILWHDDRNAFCHVIGRM